MAAESIPRSHETNMFYLNISRHMKDEDLENMTELLKDRLEADCLEKCPTPLDLLRLLEFRGIISQNNILAIQALVWLTNNLDLYNHILKYVGKDVVHIEQPTLVTKNGDEITTLTLSGKLGNDVTVHKRTVRDWLQLKLPAGAIVVDNPEDDRQIVVQTTRSRSMSTEGHITGDGFAGTSKGIDHSKASTGFDAETTEVPVIKPALKFIETDDKGRFVIREWGDTFVWDGGERISGRAYTDGRLGCGSFFWEVEARISPGPDWCCCNIGVRGGDGEGPDQESDPDHWYIGLEYNGVKFMWHRRDKFRWYPLRGDLSNYYDRYFPYHTPHIIRIGVYMETNSKHRRFVAIDCMERRVIGQLTYSQESYSTVIPYVHICDAQSGSVTIVPPENRLPSQILRDIVQLNQ